MLKSPSWPSVSTVPYPWIQPTGGSCGPVVFIEKNPCISRSRHFKPMLFKGQLYRRLVNYGPSSERSIGAI